MATDLSQADVETITRSWSIVDAAGDAVVPASIKFVCRAYSDSSDTTFTTDGAGSTINGVVDSGDGTGTWTVSAGDLAVGSYVWWALVGSGSDLVIPPEMTGEFRVVDR